MSVKVNNTYIFKLLVNGIKKFNVVVNNAIKFISCTNLYADGGTISNFSYNYNTGVASYVCSNDGSIRFFYEIPSNVVLTSVAVTVGNGYHQCAIDYLINGTSSWASLSAASAETNRQSKSWSGSVSGGGTLQVSYNTIGYGSRTNNIKIDINGVNSIIDPNS